MAAAHSVTRRSYRALPSAVSLTRGSRHSARMSLFTAAAGRGWPEAGKVGDMIRFYGPTTNVPFAGSVATKPRSRSSRTARRTVPMDTL
jgi:hypothetical protein